ncbi:MAG: hypothetical protein HN337_09980 [Deltaproteobacteria bacterium]|nr:hypothetical protein [Deltaproteobacteria bacterium]
MIDKSAQIRKKYRWIALCIAVIAITRLPTLLEPILNIDEADFAVQTAVWMDGGKPYIDFVEKKPPLIHMAYALAFEAGGVWNMQAVHILFMLIVIATGLILVLAAERVGGSKARLPALLLFTAYQSGYDLNDFLAANTETLMNLFCAASIYFAAAGLKIRKQSSGWLTSGMMAGIACLAKPVAVVMIPAIVVGIISVRPKIDTFKTILKNIGLTTSGFIIPLALCAFYLLGIGALEDAIRWVWLENVSYATSMQSLSETLAMGATRIGIYVAASLPLWILALGHIVKFIRRGDLPAGEAVLFTWILLSFITVSLGGRFFPHYFLQFIPPLTILAALGYTSWFAPFFRKKVALLRTITYVVLIGPIVGFLALHVIEIRKLPKKVAAERTIGAFISKTTLPDAKIFVWGHNSDIYFYSKRVPASRFSYCSYLTNAREGFENLNRIDEPDDSSWQMLMSDLTEEPPDIIVDMSGTGIRGYDAYPIGGFNYLSSFMKPNYLISANIYGAHIWKKN